MVIAMLYILFNILKYCRKLYQIASLTEFEELLQLKQISYSKNQISRGIIIYYNQAICIEQVVSYTSSVVKTKDRYLALPREFIVISLPFEFSYVYVGINILCYTLALSLITVNNYLTVFILLISLHFKNYLFIIHTFLMITVILNLLLYQNLIVLLSVVILITAIKYPKIIYSSVLFLCFDLHIVNLYLVYTYIVMLVCYQYTSRINEYKQRLKFSKLVVKEAIDTVEQVVIDDVIITQNGKYFIVVNRESMIKINGINFKFVSLELLFDKITIVYVKNRNSFFTNRRKYSKIKECDKIYIYLYEVE